MTTDTAHKFCERPRCSRTRSRAPSGSLVGLLGLVLFVASAGASGSPAVPSPQKGHTAGGIQLPIGVKGSGTVLTDNGDAHLPLKRFKVACRHSGKGRRTCTKTYPANLHIRFLAKPAKGWKFSRWVNHESGTGWVCFTSRGVRNGHRVIVNNPCHYQMPPYDTGPYVIVEFLKHLPGGFK